MITIANCRQPDSDYIAVDRVPLPIGQRFPVPSSVRGFVMEPENVVTFPGIGIPIRPLYTQGAVTVEGVYLEPTRGQIWPR